MLRTEAPNRISSPFVASEASREAAREFSRLIQWQMESLLAGWQNGRRYLLGNIPLFYVLELLSSIFLFFLTFFTQPRQQ